MFYLLLIQETNNVLTILFSHSVIDLQFLWLLILFFKIMYNKCVITFFISSKKQAIRSIPQVSTKQASRYIEIQHH